jgi:6-pyruvoyltetrahydropterin/6-carboxytetrahydropterin synthase
MPRFHTRISRDDLAFSAAHFITLGADTCERLHGHDYRVTVEVHGPLDDNHFVVDFLALTRSLRQIVGELDEHVLLPTGNPLIRVDPGPEQVEVTFGRRRWAFPRSNALILPIPNTTTELLAEYIGRRLIERLESEGGTRPPLVRVELEQSRGFSAICELGDRPTAP